MKKTNQNKPISRPTITLKNQTGAPTTEIKSICHLCKQQDFNGTLLRKGYVLATLSFAQSSSCACMWKQIMNKVKPMRGTYISWLSKNKSNFLNSNTVWRNKACKHREQHTEGYRRWRKDTAPGWRGSQEQNFWYLIQHVFLVSCQFNNATGSVNEPAAHFLSLHSLIHSFQS